MDPFQNLLNRVVNRKITPFAVNSRYYGLDTNSKTLDNGKSVVYLKRRFIPDRNKSSNYDTEYTVTQGDRLDNLAASYIGDPEQFWKIADNNLSLRPEELVDEPGNKIIISRANTLNT